MATGPFQLQIATLNPGVRYTALSFRRYVSENSPDPVILDACGERVGFANLFAYCVLRFGFHSEDERCRELGRYYLTTPHPALTLVAAPGMASDEAEAQFCFLLGDAKAREAIESYAYRDRKAWASRAREAMLTADGEPEWMEEWRGFCNSGLKSVYPKAGKHKHWVETVCWMEQGPVGENGTELFRQTSRASKFYEELLSAYEKVEMRPARQMRETDWGNWDFQDPLKPFAEAAYAALRELRRPVDMFGRAVNAFGETPLNSGLEPAVNQMAGAAREAEALREIEREIGKQQKSREATKGTRELAEH
jgi:hypothetical protein